MKTIDRIVAAIRRAGVSPDALMAAIHAPAPATRPKAAPKAISTHDQAERAAPGVYRVKNAKGLYLKKTTASSGAWFYRFRLDGKRPSMGLGALEDVKLADAIAGADEARPLVRAGVNPIVARRADKAKAAQAALVAADKWTFAQAAEAYVDAHAGSWKHRDSRRIVFNPLVKYAYPVIGNKPLDDVRLEHVTAIMDAAEKGGAHRLAPRIRLRIEQIFNAAIALGQREAVLGNPAAKGQVKAVRPTRLAADTHFRRIDLDQAPAVFRELHERAKDSTAFAAWAFMIATAARPSEALCAQWREIDVEKATWTVPKERMKDGKEFVVPLSSVALAVLERQARVRTNDAVFPGLSGSPLSYTAFSRAPAKAGIDAGSPHSWRSIFRDACGDKLRVDRDLAEAALAHSLGKVEAAYRRETAVEARRAVMEAYANWLMGEGVNVIAFKSRE
jgi:integrase